jgi:hypothetical protein
MSLVMTSALSACDSLTPEESQTDAATPVDPAAATQDVDSLATMLDQGVDVTAAQFRSTLDPFQRVHFESWPSGDVERLVSSFQRLRSSLVERYRIQDPICSDDSFVRYSLCEPGYACVAAVQLAELQCLWFVSH